jgi:hypothetical protein
MRTASGVRGIRLFLLAAFVVCAAGFADTANYSDWSAPVNLGAPVNTIFSEQGASLSRDGLTLYFSCLGCSAPATTSDIWVTHRASIGDPWGPPQLLGPNIDTPYNEAAPYVSVDGHRLFFNSGRPGGYGGYDLYMSRRHDARDDWGWEPPVNLGPAINSSLDESQPDVFEDEATGMTTLYYASGASGSGGEDIYASVLRADGTWSFGVPVPELNSASFDRQPMIRRDGLEMFLSSNRPGTLGGLDLWVATRATTLDPWSPPANLGPLVNGTSTEARPALSFDGTELYFQSTRTGNFDLYRSVRSKVKGRD